MKLKVAISAIALFVLLAVLMVFYLSTNSVKQMPVVQVSKFVLQTEPPSTGMRADGKLSNIEYKNLSVIDTNPIVQRYIDSNLIEFSDYSKSLQNVWVEYIYDYYDYAIGILDSPTSKEHPAKMSVLRFKSSFREPVIKGIKLGDSMERIVSILGNPSFLDKKARLIGYKTMEFYLIIRVKNVADEISFIKTPSQSNEYQIAQLAVSNYKSAKSYYLLNTFEDNKRVISTWGHYINEFSFGFVFEDAGKPMIKIYNNFDGVIPVKRGMIEIYFINKDLIFENEVKYYLSKKKVDSIENYGKLYSPDKKHFVVWTDEEESKISVFDSTGINPPSVLRFGLANQSAEWLSNHEVLITFGIDSTEYMSFDLNSNQLKPKTELDTHAKPILEADFKVSQFRLNMSFSSFKNVLENPFVKIKTSIYNGDIKVNTYRLEDGSIVEFYDGKLGNILLKSKKYASNRGLRVGDSMNKVLKLYALPHDLTGETWHYNYDYADEGEVFVVTFKNDKVKSIYVTLLD